MRRGGWIGGFATVVVCLVVAMTSGASLTRGSITGENSAQGQSAERVIKWISYQNAPLELTDVRLGGESVIDKATVTIARQSAQWKELKVNGSDRWLKYLSFTFKNVSHRRIAGLTVTCVVRHPELQLPLGLPLMASIAAPHLLLRKMPKLADLEPNEESTYSLHELELSGIDQLLNRAGAWTEVRNIELDLGRIQFDYGSVCDDGVLFHPDPNSPDRWLPEKQGARLSDGYPFPQ